MWSSAIFLELSALRSPFLVQQHFSDNGSEYKGNSTHAFVASCARLGIQQSFTKIKHPWTNGKAERVIKTLLQEWYYPNRQNFTSLEDQRTSLYNYVEWYNHERPHQGINNLTPIERLALYYSQSGDNA
jgi:transposase InsO family protein